MANMKCLTNVCPQMILVMTATMQNKGLSEQLSTLLKDKVVSSIFLRTLHFSIIGRAL